VSKMKAIIGLCIVPVMALALSGCSEDHALTRRPLAMDLYVDATFSNDEVASECMNDIQAAAKLAAASRGSLKFHTFDGDPFRRRGLSVSFGDEAIPGDIKGTSGETAYFEEQAEELEGQMEELIAEPPTVGGTPLLQLLERAGRHTTQTDALNRILICTDGLFTDVDPKKMTEAQARQAGEALPSNLRGITIDFIGLDGSAPGRGKRIEETKPLVEAVLHGAGAQLGNWDLELPPSWREETIAAIEAGADR
jgi:hypothetical protein